MDEVFWIKIFILGIVTYASGFAIPSIQATMIPIVGMVVVAVSASAILITFYKSDTDSRVIIIR